MLNALACIGNYFYINFSYVTRSGIEMIQLVESIDNVKLTIVKLYIYVWNEKSLIASFT